VQSVVKEDLRREIRRRKQQYTPSQLEELSEPIIARLRPFLADARVILAYYSLPDEVNTHQLIDDLVAEGKTVLLPKVLDATTMELRLYTGPHDLASGPFGILESTGSPFHLSTFSPSIDLAIIPGVAFDALGHRLGRGRGYYDRFLHDQLSIINCPLLVGLCFDFQKVPSVPVDPTDIPVNQVI
jgi:5-formyltetrahydrofolate cyclo-ligase